jgi:signal transduction histidine kinase
MTRVLSRFRSSGLLVLAVMLAVLLGVLAVLQYRWVGQLSADERDRMRKHLHGRADDLADDFNRELTRIFVWLQVGPDMHRGAVPDDPGAEEQRYEHWFTAAPHPELVKAIYQIDVDERGTIAFRQYQRQEARIETVAWPAELEPIRAALKIVSDPLPGLDHPTPRLARVPLLWPDVPAVLIPRARVFSLRTSPRPGAQPQVLTNSGYTVALLNLAYMREQLLPQLVTRYFPDEGGRGRTYVAIRNNNDVIYATPGALPTILKASDVEEPLWDIRFSEFSRFVIDRRPATPDRRDPIDEKLAKAVKEAKHGDAQGGVNLYYTRDERGRGPGGGGPVTGSLPVWRVHLLDKAGSLEAAVGRARWRNLVISFTVLVLLGASMSLVLLSSARARRLAAQQMEFVAGVSHELRTPLTVIRSAGENLADGIVLDEQQVRKYGALIATEGRRLTQMVEQVMTFAGLQAGKPGLDVRAVDTSLVIDEALVAMAPLVRDQDATIERDVPDELPRMLADASAVSRCIQNLLGNALKYAGGQPGEPGRIRVSARATPRLGGDQVAITVSDNGPGISPRDLPHIFEPFYRGADVVSLQIHGSGLGLSLVQRIMGELGGSVTVESEPGHGSAFTLHLPVAPNVAVASAATSNVGTTTAVQTHPLGGGADAQVRS